MKKIIKSYLADNILFTVIYSICCFTVIFYFYLTTKGMSEIIYPCLLAVFFYLIYNIINFIKYCCFYKNLEKMKDCTDYDCTISRKDYQHCQSIINSIHHDYNEKMSRINVETKNRNRFISQWIHNMKTPLSVCELICENDDISGKDVTALREENDKLLSSLNKALTILRLDEFSEDFCPEKVNLNSEVKSIIKEMKNQFIYNNVFPVINIDKNITVITDKKWNRFMLTQIISNAVKYSKQKDKQGIVTFDTNENENSISLSITDNGIGIPQNDISRVYEPFFTGENGRTVSSSSGIGLFICHQIADKLSHKLEISSQVGEYTTVKISYLSKL